MKMKEKERKRLWYLVIGIPTPSLYIAFLSSMKVTTTKRIHAEGGLSWIRSHAAWCICTSGLHHPKETQLVWFVSLYSYSGIWSQYMDLQLENVMQLSEGN